MIAVKKTAAEIAHFINGELIGKGDVVITGLNSIEHAKEGDLTFANSPKHIELIEKTRASCVITTKEARSSSRTIIRTENPALAFNKILSMVFPEKAKHPVDIHDTAVIEKDVALGKNVAIGAYSVISKGVQIGDDSVVYAGCFIGLNSKIGASTLLYPGVIVREGITIGDRVIVHSGTVIGTDGFGYHQIDGKHIKIPQVGTVIIEDDVEIGSCVTVDRATLGQTIIGRGTKIDNLVQVAHNVRIGQNCILVSQTGISGSSKLGNNVMLGGQAGLVDHISLGDKVMVAAQAGVTKSYPAGSVILGTPGRPYQKSRKIMAASGRLPNLMKRVAELEKKIAELEKNT